MVMLVTHTIHRVVSASAAMRKEAEGAVAAQHHPTDDISHVNYILVVLDTEHSSDVS
jgi:proline racemase